MTITFRAAGTAVQNSGSGNIASVGVPASTATNDIMVCVVTANDNVTCTFPAGWTVKTAANNGTGLRQTIAWKRAGASEAAFTVTHTAGADALAQAYGFVGCATSGDPFEVAGTPNPNSGTSAGGAITATGITPTHTNSAILFIASEEAAGTGGGGTNYYSGWSGTDPTFTEIADTEPQLGVNEISIGAAWGLTTDAAATGNRTVTLGNALSGNFVSLSVLLALTDASPTGGATGYLPPIDPIYVHRRM